MASYCSLGAEGYLDLHKGKSSLVVSHPNMVGPILWTDGDEVSAAAVISWAFWCSGYS